MQNIKVQLQCKAALLLLIMIVTLNMIACGRNTQSLDDVSAQADGTGPRPGDTTVGGANIPDTGQLEAEQLMDRTHFYGETLTIYALSRYSNNIAAFADEYMRRNPGITVEITTFGSNLSRAIDQTTAALAGGTAPVLMEAVMVNTHNTGYFADWLPLINATADFNDYNYFMNVINAASASGYLYAFPLTFSFSIVATNNLVSGLYQAMEMYSDGISMSRLLELARTYNIPGSNPYTEYPMYLWHNFDVGFGFEYMHGFFDPETRMVDFNNQRFIEFINYARAITYPDKEFGLFEDHLVPSLGARSTSSIVFGWWRYLFHYIRICDNHDLHGNAQLAMEHLYFAGSAPIVSDQGELIITPMETYVLNARATPVEQALAWDFMQFMVSAEGTLAISTHIPPVHHLSGMTIIRGRLPMMSINRETARVVVAVNWPNVTHHFCSMALRLTGNTGSEVAPSVNARLADIGSMPMVLAQTVPRAVNEVLPNFHYGNITAEEAALLIQGHASFDLRLME